MTGGECLARLLNDPYYETVAIGFLVVALQTAVQEHGPFSSYEELDRYLKEKLI